jgi:hypothetical protein
MGPRDLFLNAALAAIAWAPSLSQSNPPSTPRFGIIAGVNQASLPGDYTPHGNRTGFAGGLMSVLPLSPSFAIQPELMFTMKGAHTDSGGISETAKAYYVELPVLARFEIPTSERVKPFFYAGPGFAYRSSCTIEARFAPEAVMGIVGDFTGACEIKPQPDPPDPGAKYNKTDVDGIIGGGFAFDVGGRTASVSVRYDVGFVKFVTFSDSKNRVLSFMGTLDWPFRK